ncbi:MAG: ABC transporter permease [Planctomycetes bacterium]|nr:ABC transporter permease [Planctomycetota bacterium]
MNPLRYLVFFHPARLARSLRMALKSLLLHKLRSGLTMLGIVFGVFSVIAMLAIGEGASTQAQQQVLQLGATNILCVSVKPPEETSDPSQGRQWVVRYGLKEADLKLLDVIPSVVRAIPIREIGTEARYGGRTLNARLVGCTPDYFEVNHLSRATGRFLTDSDGEKFAMRAVIAHDVARELFRHEDPLGKTITVNQQFFRIIGVTRFRTASAAIGSSLSGQDYNKDIYIPLETLQTRIIPGGVDVQRKSGSFSAEEVQLNQITLQVTDPQVVLQTAETVRESIERNHPGMKDVHVVVPMELLKQAEQLRGIFNVVLGSIAFISLIVGGIGIMNIMLATVTERTREIGVRRALGAKQSDIIEQFLTETMVLSGTGGLIGVVLGLLTPQAFQAVRGLANRWILEGSAAGGELGRMFTQMEPTVPYWSLPLAFGFSVAIGVIFGLYPARAAARLDPIEALRHE